MAKLIGLHGPAGSGKSTVADILKADQDIQRIYAFAEPLKHGVAIMLGRLFDAAKLSTNFDDPTVKQSLLPPTGRTVRHILQTLGTEWGRNCIHPDLWLLLAQAEWRRLHTTRVNPTMLITDVRFQNEADWIRRAGCLWHIVRPKKKRPYIGSNGEQQHASETPIEFRPDLGDRQIINDGSLDDLTLAVRQAWLEFYDTVETGPRQLPGGQDEIYNNLIRLIKEQHRD